MVPQNNWGQLRRFRNTAKNGRSEKRTPTGTGWFNCRNASQVSPTQTPHASPTVSSAGRQPQAVAAQSRGAVAASPPQNPANMTGPIRTGKCR